MPTATPKVEEVAAIVACGSLAGFSELSAALSPVDLVEALTRYRDLVNEMLAASGAEVLFYIGDAWLALWPAPQTEEEKIKIGAAVVSLLDAVFRQQLHTGAKVKLHLGLAAGKVIRTNLAIHGRPYHAEYLSATVNFARHLQSGCVFFQCNILFPQNLPVTWPKSVQAEKVKDIVVKGIPGTQPIFTLKQLGR